MKTIIIRTDVVQIGGRIIKIEETDVLIEIVDTEEIKFKKRNKYGEIRTVTEHIPIPPTAELSLVIPNEGENREILNNMKKSLSEVVALHGSGCEFYAIECSIREIELDTESGSKIRIMGIPVRY